MSNSVAARDPELFPCPDLRGIRVDRVGNLITPTHSGEKVPVDRFDGVHTVLKGTQGEFFPCRDLRRIRTNDIGGVPTAVHGSEIKAVEGLDAVMDRTPVSRVDERELLP